MLKLRCFGNPAGTVVHMPSSPKFSDRLVLPKTAGPDLTTLASDQDLHCLQLSLYLVEAFSQFIRH